ncbi:MAG: hypothetical protein JJU33_14955 [Phycisphaerales bacterium]|nr:hypothetical protein [Phycisphaerales bacterium]
MTDFETNRALLRRVRVACLLAALGGVAANAHAQCGDWEPVGTGVTDDDIRALAVFDDGTGPALYAGGYFEEQIGGSPAAFIARWDGTAWSQLGSFLNTWGIFSLTVFESELYAGGVIFLGSTLGIARWDGTAWRPVGTGLGWGGSPMVTAMTVSGSSLYVGGNFREYIYHAPGNCIAQWNGSSWSALGQGLTNHHSVEDTWAYALAGWGHSVFAGGRFTRAGGSPANNIAQWNGSSWLPLESGVTGSVYALRVFNDGTGLALYAGGGFTQAGGRSVNRIARWNGSAWSALGEGVNGAVEVLTAFDDGTGPALYAGGWFTEAGGNPASGIARWDGSSWSALGSGLTGGHPYNVVTDLAVFDDGTGPALYAAGRFAEAGGNPASNIARWVPRPPCRADLNGDCVVDADDFFLYLDLFAVGDPIADINGDGVLDADDFFEYLALFAAGC